MNTNDPNRSRSSRGNEPQIEEKVEGPKENRPVHLSEASATPGKPNTSIHLSQLTLRRFRSCDDVTVTFQPDLTVLVGENNGGKSNVIDAMRLLTLPLNGRRERYPEEEDLRRGASTANFEIVGQYRGLSDTLKGLLITAVPDPTKDTAIFGYRYEPRSDNAPRGRSTFWAGKFDSAEPETGSTDLIRHVYLPALRDAHQALGSGSGARVMALFRHFLPKDKEKEFIKAVQRADNLPGVLTTMNNEIGTALGALTSGVRPQQAKLDFATESLLDVARSLRFKLADAGLSPEEIRASGLGYSNLLYMATVVVELSKAKETDLTLFLVEEPEAHLHPQLQMLVLEFLLENAQNSIKTPTSLGRPEGRIQIVVSTHSPNLTAWVSPKHLVVVRSQLCQKKSTTSAGNTLSTPAVVATPANQQGQEPPISRTVIVPIAALGIDPKTLGKISRYLDVTRSALLFGNKALLVEGIAESLLLPVIARKLVLKGKRDEWLRFKGTVIVSIEGVDFRPYVEVLLRANNGAHIADRVVVITDADPSVEGNRKEDLEKLATDLGAASAIHVFVNHHTLEHELLSAGNEALLKKAFLTLHPLSLADWTKRIENVSKQGRPEAFLKLLSDKRTRKGDLAQQIASLIEAGDPFKVPDYLKDAIQKIAES
jgi:putative ATP-dependent endonuclease of OLD family